MPFSTADPNLGCTMTRTPVMPEPPMNGARSRSVAALIGTANFTATTEGACVETVMLTVAGIEVPPGPVAV